MNKFSKNNNQYQDNNQFLDINDTNQKTFKNNNSIKIIAILVVIFFVIGSYFLLPKSNIEKSEKAYNEVVEKLCNAAITYTEKKDIRRREPGDTVYVKIIDMKSEYLIGNQDTKDPRYRDKRSNISSDSYIRLSMTSMGDYHCEGLIDNANDITSPIVSLNGSETIVIAKGTNLIDPGATATDDVDGDVSQVIARSGNVDTSTVGDYTIKYSASDMSGNVGTIERNVKVVEYKDLEETKAKNIDRIKPYIEIKGENPYCLERGTKYIEPGIVAKDNVDGNITEKVIIDAKVNEEISGNYRVEYSVKDTAGNEKTAYRSIVVRENCEPKKEVKATILEEVKDERFEDDETLVETPKPLKANSKPKITLKGDSSITIMIGTEYSDIGATAYDAEDGDLTHKIKIDSSSVNTSKAGIYSVSYEVVDSGGQIAKSERIVNVKSETIKNNVAKFNKTPQSFKIKLGHKFEVETLTATDSYGKSLKVKREIFNSSGEEVSSIDRYRIGKYKVRYSATPDNGVIQKIENTIEIYDDVAPTLVLPLEIKAELSTKSCIINESLLLSNGMIVRDGNNKVAPKIVIEGSKNILCTPSKKNILKVYAVDESNNKSETKTVNIIVQGKEEQKSKTISPTNVEITNCQTGKLNMYVSSELQLNTIVYPLEASNKNVIWSSSDSDILSVSKTGKIKSITVDGKVTVTVKTVDGSKTDTCEITIKQNRGNTNSVVPVETVEIGGCESGNLTVEKGKKQILSKQIKPENATNKAALFSSNNSNITITENGEVTGKNIGVAVLTLKSEDLSKTAKCNITVVESSSGVDNTEPSKVRVLSNNSNSTDPYNVSGNWSGGRNNKEIKLIVESIEKESRISKFQIFNMKGKLIKEVTPMLGNNNRAEIIWNKDINEKIQILSVNTVGLTSELSDPILMKLDNTGPTIKFKNAIEDPNKWINTPSYKLTYTAVDTLSGVAKFEYTHDDVKAKTAEEIKIEGSTVETELTFYESNLNRYVYVRAVDKLGNIGPWTQKPSYLNMDTVPPLAPTIKVIGNKTPKVDINLIFKDGASPKMSGFGKFEYKLNNGSIQSIDKEAEKFSLTTPGNYSLEAWSYDKAGNKGPSSKKNDIVVKQAEVIATSVKLSTSSINLKSNETQTLVATITPSNTTNKTITWTTSNASVATVSSNGVVKGISTGTVTITASIDGKTASARVNVVVLATSLTLNKSSVELNVNQSVTLVGTITPSNTTNKTITWTTSNASVATVSSKGVVEGISPGIATITGKIDGKEAVTKITVSSSNSSEPIKPSGTLYATAETETLKYYRVSKDGVYLTYIWMKNPYEQVKKLDANFAKYKKNYSDDELEQAGLKPTRLSVGQMIENYIELGKIPNGKAFVAFNASGFYVNGSWNPPNPYYHNRSSCWFELTEGKLIRNRYDDYPTTGHAIIGIDKNNNLKLFKHFTNTNYRQKLSNTIVKELELKNTFSFNPIMLYEGEFNEAKKSDTKKAHRQIFCQVNSNNFIMLTTIHKKTTYEASKLLESLGCKTIMNLDGGGSTQMFQRLPEKRYVSKIVCREVGTSGEICRQITNGIYFIEQ